MSNILGSIPSESDWAGYLSRDYQSTLNCRFLAYYSCGDLVLNKYNHDVENENGGDVDNVDDDDDVVFNFDKKNYFEFLVAEIRECVLNYTRHLQFKLDCEPRDK